MTQKTESDSDSQRQFAYGANRKDEHCCPAIGAGFEKEDLPRGLNKLTERYDRAVRRVVYESVIGDPDLVSAQDIYMELSGCGLRAGVVNESVAKEAWFDAVEGLEREYLRLGKTTVQKREIRSMMNTVIEDLGWES